MVSFRYLIYLFFYTLEQLLRTAQFYLNLITSFRPLSRNFIWCSLSFQRQQLTECCPHLAICSSLDNLSSKASASEMAHFQPFIIISIFCFFLLHLTLGNHLQFHHQLQPHRLSLLGTDSSKRCEIILTKSTSSEITLIWFSNIWNKCILFSSIAGNSFIYFVQKSKLESSFKASLASTTAKPQRIPVIYLLLKSPLTGPER